MADVSAELSLFFRDGRTVPEGEVADLDPEAFGPYGLPEGVLKLRSGETTCSIGDDLSYLVSKVCIGLPLQLLQDGVAHHDGFANEEVLTFTRAGDTITIESEFRPTVSFPAVGLLRALAGAARRFADWPRSLWTDESAEAKETFAQQAAEAAKAVGLE